MLRHHSLNESLSLTSFVLICLLGLLSCGGNSKMDSKDTAMELNKPDSDVTRESDERFLVNVAEFNHKGILIGKLARQRATDATVKDLAGMMEEAHRDIKSSLASLAIIKDIAIPQAPTLASMEEYEALNEKSVEDFDRAYCDLTVKDHKDAIKLFERIARGDHDPDIQSWAASKLPLLETHLARAEVCVTRLSPLSEVIH